MEITWKVATVKVCDLIPYTNNPRKITKAAFNTLVANIKANGYTNRLITDGHGVILGGNQRLEALKKLKIDEVEVLVPDRELTQEQKDRINVSDNVHAGTWDTDMLSTFFEANKLVEWGMDKTFLDLEPKENTEREKKTKLCPHCGEIL